MYASLVYAFGNSFIQSMCGVCTHIPIVSQMYICLLWSVSSISLQHCITIHKCFGRDLGSLTVRCDRCSWHDFCLNYFHAMRCVTMIYLFTVSTDLWAQRRENHAYDTACIEKHQHNWQFHWYLYLHLHLHLLPWRIPFVLLRVTLSRLALLLSTISVDPYSTNHSQCLYRAHE